MPATRRSIAALLALVLLPARATHAGAVAPGDDAFSMMHEQTVTGVSKRPLPLSEAPSSVTVIPAAEIRAMGYHTVADALRWVQGLFVTNDRNYSYVGVRGLQRPGDYNNKVLLTLDGHTMNGSVYADALLGSELGLDLEEVERIEVVRGPGSALYGSYAALAVVNIVTRRAGSRPPVAASFRAGGTGEWRGRAGVASSRPGSPEVHAGVSWLQTEGQRFGYFAPEVFPTPVSMRDGERAASFFATAAWHGVSLAAKLNQRRKDIPPASWGMVRGDLPSASWDAHDFVEIALERSLGASVELSTRAYWDGSRYEGRWFVPDGSDLVENRDGGDGDVVGTEVRGHWAPTPRQALTMGVEAQRSLRTHLYNYDVEPYQPYDDHDLTGSLVAAYLQDELRLGSRLILTAGARVDNDSRYDAVFSPRADLVWTLAGTTRLKLLGGSAFRAPCPFEILERSLPGRLAPERVVTYEAGLERQAGPVLLLVTAYDSYLRDLIDLVEVDPSGVTSFTNLSRVRARGLEGAARFTPSAGTHARVGIACQRSTDLGAGTELSNSPRWNAHALAYHTLRDGRTTVAGGLRYLSSRTGSWGHRTAAVAICDVRVRREVAPTLALGLEARNLFDARYGDPGWSDHVGDEYRQEPRALYLTLAFPAGEAR